MKQSRACVAGAAAAAVAVSALCGCGSSSGSDASAPVALQSLANAAALARPVPATSASPVATSAAGSVSLRLTADAKDPHRFGGERTVALSFPAARCNAARAQSGKPASSVVSLVSGDLGAKGHVVLDLGSVGTGVHQLPDATLLHGIDVSLAGVNGSALRSGQLVIDKPLAAAGHLTVRLVSAPGVAVVVRWTCRPIGPPTAP